MSGRRRVARCHECRSMATAGAGGASVLVFVLWLCAPPASAVDAYWVCGNGAWTDGACWSETEDGAGGATVPLLTGNVYVNSSDDQQRTVSLAAGTDPVLNALRLDGSGLGTPTVESSGGDLYATSVFIGSTGRGSYLQNAGSLRGVNNFSLGSLSGAEGYLQLSDGSVTANQHLRVGDYGTGSVDHNGGTLNVVDHVGTSLYLGARPGAEGSYTLGGSGVVNTYDTRVGAEGTGSFVQSGGEHNTVRYLVLGVNDGGIGTYELSGGDLNVGSITFVGWVGSGHVTQIDGTHSAGALYLAYDSFFGSPVPTSSGTYELQGGSLTADYETIGLRGPGLFVQNGGTHAVTYELQVGSNYAMGSSTYDLVDGTLTSGTLKVGFTQRMGTFNQSGGTNTTAVVFLNGHVSGWDHYIATGDDSQLPHYNLTGGTFTVTSGRIDGQGRGVVNVDGGALDLAGAALDLFGMIRFNVGDAAGSIGSFALAAGDYMRSWDETVGGAGTGIFTQTGGENIVDRELVIAAEAGGTGTYDLRGGSLSAWRIRNNGTFLYTGGSLRTNGGTFINGEAQPSDVLDPNAVFNIENTTVTVIGDVVNYGTIMVTNADLTFAAGSVVHSDGAIVTDPSTLRFDTLEIGAGGYLVGGPGDVFIIAGDFVNNSERGDLWDTAQAALAFSGTGDHGLRLADGADPEAFGWGTLELMNGAGLTLTGNVATGLFVASLVLGDGAVLNLNGADLLVHELVDNGGTYEGGNVVVVPKPVPLPPAWALLPAGLALVGRRRSSRR